MNIYFNLRSYLFSLLFFTIIPIKDSWSMMEEDDIVNDILATSFPTKSLKRLKRAVETPKETSPTTPSSPKEDSSLENEAPSLEEVKKSWGDFSGRKYPYASSRTRINIKDDSDGEDEADGSYNANVAKSTNETVIILGTRLKLLANVYLRNLDEMANIFFPRYTIIFQGENGEEKESDFFRIPPKEHEKNQGSAGKICVFASGGLYNTWEKTVAHIQKIFFGARVKVIRASWIQKHLIKEDLEEKFFGRENELHSEYYFDIFFRNSFIPWMREKYPNAKSLLITAYSWWDVCNKCEKLLTDHRDLLHSQGVTLSYQIASTRCYHHMYQENTAITELRVSPIYEQQAWKLIWSNVTKFAKQDFPSPESKERFWAQTKDGLELCKWLGQAFVENAFTLSGKRTKPSKKGDILKFYNEMAEEDTQQLRDLLDYLREKNWDLSCWYRGRCPDKVQNKWKIYWRQVVLPHFGWKRVGFFRDEGGNSYCEMCGNKDVVDIHLIFHPKFRVSESLLEQLNEEEEASEDEVSIDLLTAPFGDLPFIHQRKRRQSLCVGSECVKVLSWSKHDIDNWREDNPNELVDHKWQGLVERQDQNEALDKAEKRFQALKRKAASSKRKQKGMY